MSERISRRLPAVVVRQFQRLQPWPKVSVAAHGTIPVWPLRVACGAGVLGGASLVATNNFAWLVAIILAGAVVIQPEGPGASLGAVGAGLALLTTEGFATEAMLLAFGAHLLVVLTAVIGDVGWNATVEWRTLTEPLRRFVPIQVFVQLAGLGAAQFTDADLDLPWVPLAAGILLVLTAWAGMGWLHRHR